MLILTISVFLILFGSLAANGILFVLLSQRQVEIARLKSVYRDLTRDSSLPNVLSIIERELPRFGLTVHATFVKNKTTMAIQDDKFEIPIMARSNIIRAFLTNKLILRNAVNITEVDSKLNTAHGNKIAYLPISMKRGSPCWEAHHCDDKACRCFNQDVPSCWVTSDKRCRGYDRPNYEQKLTGCLKCSSFLPVAVFVVSGAGWRLRRADRYVKRTFPEIVSNAVLYERAKFGAYRDQLTGLMNRRGLLRRNHELVQLSKRYEHPLSLCMLDIDHFKMFNDTYGHDVGDFVLKSLAAFMASCVRDTDVLARYGGEEFTILLPETTKMNAQLVLDKIRQKVDKERFTFRGIDHHIKISMGVAEWFEDQVPSVSALYKKADCALYNAKIKGRNQVVAYHSGLEEAPEKGKTKETASPSPTPAPRKKASSSKGKKVHIIIGDGGMSGGSSATVREVTSILDDDEGVPEESATHVHDEDEENIIEVL